MNVEQEKSRMNRVLMDKIRKYIKDNGLLISDVLKDSEKLKLMVKRVGA
jgi:hypothetical protein